MFYHYGAQASLSGHALYEFRCPTIVPTGACNRMRHVGIDTNEPDVWWETKCFRCHQYYHFGKQGRGMPAIVTLAGPRTRPRLPASSNVRATRLTSLEFGFAR